jgi:hypothetical protein
MILLGSIVTLTNSARASPPPRSNASETFGFHSYVSGPSVTRPLAECGRFRLCLLVHIPCQHGQIRNNLLFNS